MLIDYLDWLLSTKWGRILGYTAVFAAFAAAILLALLFFSDQHILEK